MRAPTLVEAHPSRIWRGGLLLVLIAAAAAIVAWCATSGDVVSWWARVAVSAIALAIGAGVVRLAVAPPAALRWTGAAWELLPAGAATPLRGVPAVAIDFGTWMLLRFSVEGSHRVVWLPVERQDASGWHALRAALYSGPGGRR